MNDRLRNLIFWKEPRLSGVTFILGLLVLIALSLYSVLVVVTCIAIPALIVTLVIRTVFAAKAAIFKQPNHHPFQYLLEEKWEVRGDKVDTINRRAAYYTNAFVLYTKKIILIEDFVESLKGLVFLLLWYYIGRNISVLTLIFFGYFGLFTMPKVYDMYRKEIDNTLRQIYRKYEECYGRIIYYVPGVVRTDKTKKEKIEKEE